MGRYCCVVNCKNTDRVRPGQKRPTVKRFFRFYALKSLPPAKLQLWLNAINRKNPDGTPWKPGSYSTICNEHFLGGVASQLESAPNYIPTIFPPRGDLFSKSKRHRHQSLPRPVGLNSSMTCSPDIRYPAKSSISSTPTEGDVKPSPSTFTSTQNDTDEFKGFDVRKYNITVSIYTEFWEFVSSEYEDLDIKPPPKWKALPEPLPLSGNPSVDTEQLLSKLTNPLLKIPLTQYGWRREIVCRTSNSPDVARNRMFDVFYYSPEGKKLRSSTQIMESLPPDTELRPEHFSFSKGLTGLSAEHEWVREVKSSMKVEGPNQVKQVGHIIQSKPVKKPSLGNPRKRRRSKASFYDMDDDLDLGMMSPDWLPTVPGTTREAMENPLICSILCPAALGCIPTLQCTSCLCLYHPQCLKLDPENTYKNYVCPNCKKKVQEEQEEQKAKKLLAQKKQIVTTTTTIPQKAPPPIAPMPNKVITFTSKLIPSQSSKSISQPNKSTHSKAKQISAANKPIAPKPLRPLAPVPSHNNFTNVIHNPPFVEEPMQSVIQLGNKKFIAIPKSQVNSKTGETIHIGNKKFIAIPNSVSSPGKTPSPTIISPPAMRSENQLPAAKASLTVPYVPNVPGLLISVPNSQQYYVLNNNQIQTILPKPASKDEPASKKTKTSPLKKSPTLASESLFSLGSSGMTVLIHVFQHLQLNDLLRAAQVNRLFYAASRHFTLWKTVHLKNSLIQDWEKFARTLDKNDTEKINFNKMISRTDSEEVKNMWRSINQALSKIPTLRHLELGKCAGPEITILKQCPNLTHFSCTFNKKSVLDFYGFSQIQNLSHLYIRGLELNKLIGLKVLNIHVLSKLKHLTHLGLTSVKQSAQDTNWAMFLADMTQLQCLELGECSNFTEEFVKNALAQLVNLKRLRLEMVTELIANDVLSAIATFQHLDTLELVNFDVKPGFEEAFASCVNLKHVLIIPTYIKQSAVTVQRMMIALSSMNSTLTRVVWGLTRELLKVTEMLVTQHDFPLDAGIDCTTCIPIMPKIRLSMGNTPEAKKAVQVEVIPVSQLKEMLVKELPNVDVKLIIVSYVKTLRQFLPN